MTNSGRHHLSLVTVCLGDGESVDNGGGESEPELASFFVPGDQHWKLGCSVAAPIRSQIVTQNL